MIRTISRLAVILLVFSVPAVAQRETDASLPGSSFEIAGQVRGASGQKTVANVMVRIESFGGSLLEQISTDGTGRFRFSRLRAGLYIVTARVEGFAAASSQIDINRHIPRQYVILQLQPVDATFRRDKKGVIDAQVSAGASHELERAQRALESKKPELAVKHLEKAIQLSPDFFGAQVLLGSTNMELGNLDKAERNLQRALEIKPKTSSPLILLGELYRRQKKYVTAENALVEGLKVNRASWQGHFTLGRVYWESGDVQKAAPHIGQAIELKQDQPEPRILAGNIFIRLGMPENALIEYEEYLRLAPQGEFATAIKENVRKLRMALATKK
jgi:tetratricopeptide (TPR) repeat protein